MALLPDIRNGGDGHREVVPGLSIFVAFALVLASVGIFIHYINHMAQAVRAVTIIKKVSQETRRCLLAMYPEVAHGADEADEAHALSRPGSDPATVMFAGPGGVLSMADERALFDLACRTNVALELVPMPGDFVPRGAPLFRIWGNLENVDGSQLERQLHDAVIIAEERTPEQDPAFGFRQLVDIAERALSPGVNDPSTAVQALDELHDLLRTLAGREFPSPLRLDDTGKLRLILPRPDWSAYVHLALDEIRQYGCNSIQVVRRIKFMLHDCLAVAPPNRRGPLREQLRLLERAIQDDIPEPDRSVARVPSAQGHGQD